MRVPARQILSLVFMAYICAYISACGAEKEEAASGGYLIRGASVSPAAITTDGVLTNALVPIVNRVETDFPSDITDNFVRTDKGQYRAKADNIIIETGTSSEESVETLFGNGKISVVMKTMYAMFERSGFVVTDSYCDCSKCSEDGVQARVTAVAYVTGRKDGGEITIKTVVTADENGNTVSLTDGGSKYSTMEIKNIAESVLANMV